MTAEFNTVRVVGPMLPPDMLGRVIAGDKDLAGLKPSDYHLASGETPREAANRAWAYLCGAWANFRTAVDALPPTDPAVGLTRERWLLILLRELGYGRVPTTPTGGLVVGDHAFAVSHLWEQAPIHLLGWNTPLDKRTKGVPGAAERAPHPLLQELLNREDRYLWALVSNGRLLRILRDSTSLAGQSYVEFDLEAMFDGEVFSDFVLLYLMVHQSRVEVLTLDGPASDCWLERWRTASIESGTRALGLLRDGVRDAIAELGTGFLQHPANADLRRRLDDRELDLADYHRSLLRLVYRLLFLFVAEDRDALLVVPGTTPGGSGASSEDREAAALARDRFTAYFSTARLRRLALRRRGTKHGDLWAGQSVVIDALGREEGRPELGLPGLGGLFDHGPADVVTGLALPNDALLAAVRDLSVVQPKGQPKRTVDYRNLGAEELGSIYESLLELVPRHNGAERTFTLETLAGNDRKTSGSYYTPSSLIYLVLDEALDPLLDEAEKTPNGGAEAALLALTVCDPACGSGHFLVAAARRIAARLARVRTQDIDPSPDDLRTAMHDVVARCIYGVDLNPMAAELAKVSLWVEALQPGRPLTFLDSHIKVGNALHGTIPALLAAGIPDAAYKPVEGDDKKWAAALRKRNRAEIDERLSSQGDLFADAGIDVSNSTLRDRLAGIESASQLSLTDAHVARARPPGLETQDAVGANWDRDWLFGWRDITNTSNERTFVPSVLPRTAVGHVLPLAFPGLPTHGPLLQATWSSLPFDYIARQKLGGIHLTFGVVNQLACPTPATFAESAPWRPSITLDAWIRPRVLELTYTSWRIASYANDVLQIPVDADPGPPFRWIPERRELFRAELDAAMFHIYGLDRAETQHVLDSFPVVRKYEERDHGEFRTKRLVLDRYDAMANAIATGDPYVTPLDPEPGAGPRHAPLRA